MALVQYYYRLLPAHKNNISGAKRRRCRTTFDDMKGSTADNENNKWHAGWRYPYSIGRYV